jgi:hypothetical protein
VYEVPLWIDASTVAGELARGARQHVERCHIDVYVDRNLGRVDDINVVGCIGSDVGDIERRGVEAPIEGIRRVERIARGVYAHLGPEVDVKIAGFIERRGVCGVARAHDRHARARYDSPHRNRPPEHTPWEGGPVASVGAWRFAHVVIVPSHGSWRSTVPRASSPHPMRSVRNKVALVGRNVVRSTPPR